MTAERVAIEQGRGTKRQIVQVLPRIDTELADLLSARDILFQASQLHNGPVHLIIPEVMDRNIRILREAFEELGLDLSIYFAHKASKSLVFPRQAKKNNINIDVASRAELSAALSSGFTGKNIICTGPKNREFLRLALMQECLISCDSEDELEKIADLLEEHPEITNAAILLRISNVRSNDRKSLSTLSRFGMPQEKCPLIFEWLHQIPRIHLRGFHYHNDERGRDAKSGFIDNLIRLLEMAYEAGHSPDMIDIGGGLRSVRIQDPGHWSDFIDQVAEGLLNRTDTGTWRNFGMGMSINPKGAIAGREQIQGKHGVEEEYADMLKAVLTNDSFRGRPLSEVMIENGFSIAIEPGFALLQQCGLSLLKVIGIKESANGTPLILVDGNIYSLSMLMSDILYDPILIPQEIDEDDDGFEAHLIGNMCREEDIITKRRIRFSQLPCEGDLICFTNTAPYNMDFEDTNPHLHPSGKRFVAHKRSGKWALQAEETYNPYN